MEEFQKTYIKDTNLGKSHLFQLIFISLVLVFVYITQIIDQKGIDSELYKFGLLIFALISFNAALSLNLVRNSKFIGFTEDELIIKNYLNKIIHQYNFHEISQIHYYKYKITLDLHDLKNITLSGYDDILDIFKEIFNRTIFNASDVSDVSFLGNRKIKISFSNNINIIIHNITNKFEAIKFINSELNIDLQGYTFKKQKNDSIFSFISKKIGFILLVIIFIGLPSLLIAYIVLSLVIALFK